MLVTVSWGGDDVPVEVDAECRTLDSLKSVLHAALPSLDLESACLKVGGRCIDNDDAVCALEEACVIQLTASPAALALTTLGEEGCRIDLAGFCNAARAGDTRLCGLYLDVGIVCPTGQTSPLHQASVKGHLKACKLLLDRGCACDAEDCEAHTPLHCAARPG